MSRAYSYLNFVMDAYQQGSTLRLLQSFNNESGLLTTGFVYDNALTTIAYLSTPTSDNVRRATLIGDSLLLAQSSDAAHDGRVRQAYVTGPMVFYGGGPFLPGFIGSDGGAIPMFPFGFTGSAVGDVAWVGLALAQLYAHTGKHRFLDGAQAAAQWIVNTSTSPYHFGGFLGGVQGDGATENQWSSTEHNIDCYGLFRLLARFTGKNSWREQANNARGFVEGMWESEGGFFYTGTQSPSSPYPDPNAGLPQISPAGDPNAINKAQKPEDVNTWSFLSLGDDDFARSIDWAASNLGTTDTSSSPNNELPAGYHISGVTFSDRSKVKTGPVPNGIGNNDTDAVWLEGTGHLAAALLARGDRGRHGQPSDSSRAAAYLDQIVSAQTSLGANTAGPNPTPQTVGRTSRADGSLFDPGEGGTWTGTPLPAKSGIVAASSDFDTAFGFAYFQRQHIGATSWFLMAALGVNPYRV